MPKHARTDATPTSLIKYETLDGRFATHNRSWSLLRTLSADFSKKLVSIQEWAVNYGRMLHSLQPDALMQFIWQQAINFGQSMRSSEEQMQSHLVKFDQLNTTESDPLAQQGDNWIEVSLPRVGSAAVLGHRQSRGRHFGSDIQHVSI